MWSPSKYAEPPQPHQSYAYSFWEFRKRHIDVPDTMLQYWMLIAGFGYLWCMGGSRKFCLGGWVSWKLYFSFFTEGSADLASFSKKLDPLSYFFSRLSITVFLRKQLVILQVGCKPAVPYPRDTHKRCLANNLNSIAQSVAYLLNMQADRRSHPAYFSWNIVSSPDDSRRPSCQLLV